MSELAVTAAPAASLRDFLELSKARIVVMILITTAAGFVVAGGANASAFALLGALIGTALVAAGTNALNQFAERDLDARMLRTRNRPLPAGRMTSRAAAVFAISVSVIGTLYLFATVPPLAALLAFATLATYLFVYTPLKQKSTLCTLVGAIPGAIPPMIGWAAATGTLNVQAATLFVLMFVWQLPHFLAISWMYREDYGRAGFRMTSVEDADGSNTSRQAVLYSIALVPLTIAPLVVGLGDVLYGVGSGLAAVALLVSAIRFARLRTRAAARVVFAVSNLYLVCVMSLLVASQLRG